MTGDIVSVSALVTYECQVVESPDNGEHFPEIDDAEFSVIESYEYISLQ